MRNALIFSPGLDGHRQVYVFVLTHVLEELDFKIHIAANLSQNVFNSFYFDKLKNKPGITIIDTSKYGEGGLKITHLEFLELQNKYLIDLTIFPEADHHISLLVSQIPKNKNCFRGKLIGIFLRPFYYYNKLGLIDKLRYLKNLPSRWDIDNRLFHEVLLPRFSLLDKALFIDENFVTHHKFGIWLPDVFQQYADQIIQNEKKEQRIWIDRLNDFIMKNNGRFPFLYFGTAQYRRGYDILLKMAVENDGSFIHCGIVNLDEPYIYDVSGLRNLLSNKGHLFETNQFLEDPLCIESFFNSVTHLVLPYRDFFGSSGVMLQSLSYGIPVLAPENGIIGHRIRKYQLGVTYKPENPDSLYTQFNYFKELDSNKFSNNIKFYMNFQTAGQLKKALIRVFTCEGEPVKHP